MGIQSYDKMTDITIPESHLPYPALTRVASASVAGTATTATSIFFSDKIMLTITQNGRLAQWVQVPLFSDNPTHSDPHFSLARDGIEESLDSESDEAAAAAATTSLLPATRFQPRVLLGAGGSERELMGQVYASQIASLIVRQNREESRTLLLGLGFEKVQMEAEVFGEVLELVGQVL